MLPATATMLTVPSASMSPTVTLCAATNRTTPVAPALTMRLPACCVIEPPVPASMSMPPRPVPVLEVWTVAVPVKPMLRAATMLTLPLPLPMLAAAEMSLSEARVCSSTLPVPLAETVPLTARWPERASSTM